MLTDHQWCPVTFTYEHFHKVINLMIWFWKVQFQDFIRISLGPMNKMTSRSLRTCYLHRDHDDVIKWNDFPRFLSPVNSPHKGQWRRALVFFDLRLNERLNKQSWGWWFETTDISFQTVGILNAFSRRMCSLATFWVQLCVIFYSPPLHARNLIHIHILTC